MARTHAAPGHLPDRHHLLERKRVGMAQPEVGLELIAHLWYARGRGFVEADRYVELHQRSPERIVVAIAPLAAGHDVRAHEHAAKPELAHAALRLGDRVIHVER